jgi:hypothetical protein
MLVPGNAHMGFLSNVAGTPKSLQNRFILIGETIGFGVLEFSETSTKSMNHVRELIWINDDDVTTRHRMILRIRVHNYPKMAQHFRFVTS